MRFRIHLAIALAATTASAVHAQDINVDFGLPTDGPPADYAAAGLAGHWNAIEGEHTPFHDPEVVYELLDVHGAPTSVLLWQFGGLELFDTPDPFIPPAHDPLLEDGLVTFDPSLEICLWIDGLENGCYEVLMYGIKPQSPNALSRMRHDDNPPPIVVGGAWPGAHVEGITYSRHVVEVVDGFLGSHAGLPPGGSPTVGAVLNGLQLRRLDPADLDGSGAVDFGDLLQLLAAWGPCAGDCPEDLDASGEVGFDDLLALLGAWG